MDVLKTGAALAVAASLGITLAGAQSATASAKPNAATLQAKMARDAEHFVENKGQWDSRAKFLSRTPNLDLWVTNRGLVLDYYRNLRGGKADRREGQVLDMSFAGASKSAKAVGLQKSRLITQYLPAGKSFAHAKTARSFGEARVNGLYPGVDMRVYLQNDRPRYDLEVAPNADASRIRIDFKGAKALSVKSDGTLVIPSKLGPVEQQGLYAYQIVDGQKRAVEARFKLLNGTSVRYELGAYDHSKKLIIDPLIYGSYYGGEAGLDEVRAIVADTDGGVFMTGLTASTDFPVTAGPYGVNLNGISDSYLTKFQGDAYDHDYCAYFGGSGNDTGKYIGMDPTGTRIWIAGVTSSTNFSGVTGGSFRSAKVGTTDIFLIEFQKDVVNVLSPVYSTYFGSTSAGNGETMKGFAVSPITGRLFIAGLTIGTGIPGAINAYPGSAQAAYVTSMNSAGTGVVYSRYIGGTAPVTIGTTGIMVGGMTSGSGGTPDPTSGETGNALAIDHDDNAFVAGTVYFTGNQDTSTAPTPAFPTTSGVFAGGRLLHNNDAWVTKIDAAGAVGYAALIGGADNDTGMNVATDPDGSAYVSGLAGSFDFPRTRGAFNEDFSYGQVFITKVIQDGSEILYSTGLKTRGNIMPTGIATDQRGFVFVTGEIWDKVTFPPASPEPTSPWEPSGQGTKGSIPTTSDALRGTYAYPQQPDMSSCDAWLMILDNTGSRQIYGTYIGGDLDDYAYSPYTDHYGDCWVMGWTDAFRMYQRVSQDMSTVHTYVDSANMAPFITPLAFKNTPGTGGDVVASHYGDYAENLPFGATPPTVDMFRGRDGYLLRFRIDTPIVQTLDLNPTTIPGGLNAASTGTITLNINAPQPGVDINVTSSDPNVAFFGSPGDPQPSIVVHIDAGTNTGTFTVYSNPVTTVSTSDIKAELYGNFQVKRLTVVPWLQKLTLSPTSIVGGNTDTGIIQLASPAPAGGVDVSVFTNDTSLISFPNGDTVNVPEGQMIATFPVATKGVDVQTDVTVTAATLGFGDTKTLTLKQVSLQQITFDPPRVAGGTSSTGTLKLNGLPGPTGFDVDLTINAGTAGYTIVPTQLHFGPNDRTQTFTVNTVPENVNTQRIITATRAAQGSYTLQSVSGTLFIDANFLTNLTINPSTVDSGQPSTGTVTISNAAPTGGVIVYLYTSDAVLAQVPTSVTVPSGQTSATFTITTGATGTDATVDISASRYSPAGSDVKTRTLTIRGVAFTLTLDPTSVIGGSQNSTGTITLPVDAPAGGVTVNLTSSNPAVASVPASVVVPSGQKTVTFTATTFTVATTQNITITGETQPGTTASAILQVRAISLTDLIVSPSVVKGGTITHITVKLDAPAPSGGATVLISSTYPTIIAPLSITVPAGQTQSATVTVPVGRVNRTLAVLLTGNYNGKVVARIVTVLR